MLQKSDVVFLHLDSVCSNSYLFVGMIWQRESMTRLIVIFLGVRPVALSPYATLAPSSPDMKRDTKSTGVETPAFAYRSPLKIEMFYAITPFLIFLRKKKIYSATEKN